MLTYVCILEAISTIKIVDISLTPESFLMFCCNPYAPITSVPRQLLICFLSLCVSFHFLELYVDGIIQCLLFLCQAFIIHYKLSRVLIVHSFNLLGSVLLYGYTIASFPGFYGCGREFIHLSVVGHLRCCQLLNIAKIATMNIHVKKLLGFS